MQATTSATANPMPKQASTAGASFWSILASTTDLATPVAGSAVPLSPTVQQPDTTASAPTAATPAATPDQNAGTAAGTLPAQLPAASVAADPKAAAANITLAQMASNTTPGASANQRRTSDNSKSSNNSSASTNPTTATPAVATVLPLIQFPMRQPVTVPSQIQVPVQQSVTIPAASTAADTPNPPTTTQTTTPASSVAAPVSLQSSQGVSSQDVSSQAMAADIIAETARASAPGSTTQPADASAKGNTAPQSGTTTPAMAEAGNASETANVVVTAATTAVARSVQDSPAAHIPIPPVHQPASDAATRTNGPASTPGAVATKAQSPAQNAASSAAPAATQQQPPAPAPDPRSAAPAPPSAITAPASGTDGKPQSEPTRNVTSATVINVGLPQILTAQPATTTPTTTTQATTLAAISGLPILGSLPNFSSLPGDPSGIVKAGQSAVSATGSANASGSSANAATANNAAATADKSSHNASNSDTQSQNQSANPAAGATPQHTSDAAAAVTAKVVDTGAAALQSVPHSASSAQLTSDHAVDTARTAETPRMPVPVPADTETPAASGVNAAHLIQMLGQTGMQVGMHSAEFGDISIRTLVSQQQMTAQISVDHGDLGRAIAAHVPTVQTKLGDQFGIHASIQVNHGGASFSGEQGSSSGGQQKTYRSPAQTGSVGISQEMESAGLGVSMSQSDRLDIQA